MFGSRKRSLTIALTLVFVLAMLAPAAMAAPEWVHGLVIDKPTKAAPLYVNPEALIDSKTGEANITVDYTVTIYGTQVDDVWVRGKLLDKYGEIMADWGARLPAASFKTGANALSFELNVLEYEGTPEEGWYDLKVCAGDEWSDKWCDFEESAVLIEYSTPKVDLEKPEWKANVTGKAYLLVGNAFDKFGITKVEFQYCDISNSPHFCTKWVTLPDDPPEWVKIATGVLTAPQPVHLAPWVQYEATWDSTQVPDEWPFEWHGGFPDSLTGGPNAGALIRMCAWNLVNLSNCYGEEAATRASFDESVEGGNWPDAHKVYVNNRYMIDLEPGWNLISTPLMPYDTKIESVLAHLIANKTVKQVVSRSWTGSAFQWNFWTPTTRGPQALTTLEDGNGYWINMAAEDELTIVGTWKSVGPLAPPEYGVFDGWNLIGYTQWGRPVFREPKFAMEYLGPGVHPYVQSLWRYDAGHEVYKQVVFLDDMVKGAGYWLATIQDGRINP